MGFKAAAGGLVFLLSVSVIQSQSRWGVTFTPRYICALKGSSVELRCTYRYPSTINYWKTVVEKTFWFTKTRGREPVDLSTDPEYAGRVQNRCYMNRCTLTITDLRESDSAEYKFRLITNQPGGGFIGSPGVTLSVTDPALQVKETSSNTWTGLSCVHSGCRRSGYLSYVWYKNGQKIDIQTSYYPVDVYPGDSYVCALRGHEDFHSPPLCVGGRSCNTVTYTDRSICAPKGSSVDISSTYSSSGSITSKLWFRSERSGQWVHQSQPEDLSEDPQYAGRVQVLEAEGGRSTVRISELTERDSAQYHFTFTAGSFEWRSSLPGTTLTVTALQVQVTTATVHQLSTEAELKCLSSCSPATRLSFVWFKNGQKIMTEETSSYKDKFYSGDDVSCAFRGREDYRSPPVYAPKLPSVSVNSSEILEGSSVTLTCSSDANPAANYTWYKNGAPLSEEPQLVLSSVQSSHSGEYYCTAVNVLGRRTSERISVNVKYAPKLPSVSVSPSAEIVEGSSVNLTCSSDANPAANYTWYKGNQVLFQGQEGSYSFPSIRSEDRGIYYCKSENQHGHVMSSSLSVDVQYAPKLPSVSVSPSAEIVEGSSVTLTCSSDANPAANYTWYKGNQVLFQGQEGSYSFPSIRSEDRGIYYCKAENQYGHVMSSSLSVDVLYAPRLPSVSASPSAEIVEGSSVNLTCSSDANPAANYTWYKEDQDSPAASGQIFSITDFRSNHSGNYYCEAWNKIGFKKSALYLSVFAEKLSVSNIIRLSLVVVMLIPLLLLCLWMRKKEILLSTTEVNEAAETVELEADPDYVNAPDVRRVTTERTEDPEEQEDLV